MKLLKVANFTFGYHLKLNYYFTESWDHIHKTLALKYFPPHDYNC